MKNNADLLIVLPSLAAEGCPILAYQITKYLLRDGYKVEIAVINSSSNSLLKKFKSLGINIDFYNIEKQRFRYLSIIKKR